MRASGHSVLVAGSKTIVFASANLRKSRFRRKNLPRLRLKKNSVPAVPQTRLKSLAHYRKPLPHDGQRVAIGQFPRETNCHFAIPRYPSEIDVYLPSKCPRKVQLFAYPGRALDNVGFVAQGLLSRMQFPAS